jgi:hypothetical protein
VGVALLKVGGVKLGNSSWMKFGRNDSILVHVIPQSRCFGDSISDWLLGVIKLSKMPWVDMTSNMFFRDSGMASYLRRVREGERERDFSCHELHKPCNISNLTSRSEFSKFRNLSM